jgi:hypothetical protein
MPRHAPRPRLLTATLLLFTIALGLASRRYAEALPDIVVAYAGDALWAAMVFWIASFFLPNAKTRTLSAIALGVSFAVELSQLYQAPWINEIRATRLGALALGHGFLERPRLLRPRRRRRRSHRRNLSQGGRLSPSAAPRVCMTQSIIRATQNCESSPASGNSELTRRMRTGPIIFTGNSVIDSVAPDIM